MEISVSLRTSLELQDSEEDQKRLKEAERKAREIESEAMVREGEESECVVGVSSVITFFTFIILLQTNHGIDDVGTEEEK